MDDLISRQAAIEILHEALDAVDQIADVSFGVYQNYRDKMNELPPAQPRIKGHWIEYIPEHGKCPFCGNKVDLLDGSHHYFCEECGAEMEVTE